MRSTGIEPVLVAGQAVNLWAGHYLPLEKRLCDFLPFVSKDVDLMASAEDFLEISSVIDCSSKRFKDVRQPMIGFIETHSTPSLKIEILRTIFGPVSSAKINSRAHGTPAIRVIDPLSLLVSKAHNASGIDQENRQDVRQTRMMVLVAESYFLELLQAIGTNLTTRQFLNEIKYLLGFADSHAFRKGLALADASLRDCFPLPAIRGATECNETLRRFCEGTFFPAHDRLDPPI